MKGACCSIRRRSVACWISTMRGWVRVCITCLSRAIWLVVLHGDFPIGTNLSVSCHQNGASFREISGHLKVSLLLLHPFTLKSSQHEWLLGLISMMRDLLLLVIIDLRHLDFMVSLRSFWWLIVLNPRMCIFGGVRLRVTSTVVLLARRLLREIVPSVFDGLIVFVRGILIERKLVISTCLFALDITALWDKSSIPHLSNIYIGLLRLVRLLHVRHVWFKSRGLLKMIN